MPLTPAVRAHLATVVVGAFLLAAPLAVAACLIDPEPPDPHCPDGGTTCGDPPDPKDAGDAGDTGP